MGVCKICVTSTIAMFIDLLDMSNSVLQIFARQASRHSDLFHPSGHKGSHVLSNIAALHKGAVKIDAMEIKTLLRNQVNNDHLPIAWSEAYIAKGRSFRPHSLDHSMPLQTDPGHEWSCRNGPTASCDEPTCQTL